MTGCVYSPKDDHSTHYHGNKEVRQEPKRKPLADQDFIQQYKQTDNTVDNTPYYDHGFDKVVPYTYVRANPHYNPTPNPVNRTVYYIERY